MKYVYFFEELNINVEVLVRKQKNIILHFRPGVVVITSPTILSLKKIKEYLLLYKNRILPQPSVEEGMFLHLWGKRYELKIYRGNHFAYRIENDNFILLTTSASETRIKRVLKDIYIKELKSKAELVYYNLYQKLKNDELYAEYLNKDLKLNYTYAKSFLGRYFKKTGKIELSGYLAKYEEKYIEGVIAHELVHSIEFSHSKAFHNQLARIYDSEKNDRLKMQKLAPLLEKDYV